MRRAAPLAGVLLAIAVAVPAPAGAAFPGANGRIAFVRPGEGIFTVRADGETRRRVSPEDVRGSGCDSDPAWSPTGLELAFQTCDPARHATEVGVMAASGAGRRIVAADGSKLPSPQTPAFAPGGRRVAFAAGASPATRLYSVRTDGRHRRRIGAVGYAPSWSVRGPLAYAVPLNRRRWCNSTELDDVYALDASLRKERRLTRNHASYAPDWAPDGRHLAYTRDYSVPSGEAGRVRGTRMDCRPVVRAASASYGPEIVVAPRSGRHAHRLTRHGGSDPSWSPDGKLIAFERAGWIWTVRASGGGARRLVRGTQPAWQPLP